MIALNINSYVKHNINNNIITWIGSFDECCSIDLSDHTREIMTRNSWLIPPV